MSAAIVLHRPGQRADPPGAHRRIERGRLLASGTLHLGHTWQVPATATPFRVVGIVENPNDRGRLLASGNMP
jgi:hypothetical protein